MLRWSLEGLQMPGAEQPAAWVGGQTGQAAAASAQPSETSMTMVLTDQEGSFCSEVKRRQGQARPSGAAASSLLVWGGLGPEGLLTGQPGTAPALGRAGTGSRLWISYCSLCCGPRLELLA